MFRKILAYFFRPKRKHERKFISQRDLETYMRIEGIVYRDLFPD